MGKGYILVNIFKVKEALPETKGSLKIINSKTGKMVYEKENAFDISGRSEKIEVETPDKSLSLKPQKPGFIPYGIYNIEVTSPGYEKVVIEGISVFDENTSIENIELKKQGKNIDEIDKIVIPEQQLVLNEPRNRQVGPIQQPYTLNKAQIPEYIIVHLGTPKSNAENVTVKFIEYIKNVASSEIYPTWPEESLRSNIYCQISFALNRVYTEWYRNKGYSFQITNSTAYDQYFIKGRNIFENISKIVDSIFNEYIAIIGNKTPYFAQYCNGTASTCSGLSQWGTVDLANQGRSSLNIIKYYYGNDKEIVRTSIIQGIPESYPGKALRVNDVNENVKVIQNQLNRIAKNYPAIPKISSVNGVFDKQTEDAVKVFQGIFNLIVDGIVGRATWYKISEIYVAVKRLAELNQEPETGGEETGGEGIYPGYLLKYGSRGKEVEELQKYLNYISKYYDIGYVNVDGIYGNQTKYAVLEFQKLFGLGIDGIVGEKTWNKIYKVYQELNGEIPGNKYDGKYPGYLLKEYAKGEKVKELQSYLSRISEYYNIPNISVDGIFGNDTKRAVLAFQKIFGLDQDGIVGPKTWSKIYEVYKGILKYNTKFAMPLYLSSYPGYLLRENLKGEDIKWLQTYLQAIANYYKEIPYIEVSGVFNKETKVAVKSFQRKFGLNDNGKVGANDWEKLILLYNNLDDRIENDNVDFNRSYLENNLMIGDCGGYVTVLQQNINIAAKNCKFIKSVQVTRIFDENTKEAVKNLQKQLGLDISGVVDKETWSKLNIICQDLYRGREVKYKKKDNSR